ALAELAAQQGVDEAMILSTCNRTELYCSVRDGAEPVPSAWLHARNQMTPGRLDEFLYRHTDGGAPRVRPTPCTRRWTACCKTLSRWPSACAPKPASAPVPFRSRLPRSGWWSRLLRTCANRACC